MNHHKGFINIALIVLIATISSVVGYFALIKKSPEVAQKKPTNQLPAISNTVAPLETPKPKQATVPTKNSDVSQPQAESAKKVIALSPPQQGKNNSNIVPVYPTRCAPTHGFDGYRTDETFVINPKNNKEMYVDIEFKGLFKSIDGGKTWSFSGNGVEAWPRSDDPTKPCYMEYMSMYIDPINPQRVFLIGGSAPGKVSDPQNKPGGLHESLDGGKSWHQLFSGNMNAYTIDAISDPRDPKIIYVTTAALPASNIGANTNTIFVKEGVVYKSVDAGKSWRELPTGFVPHTRVISIFMSSIDSNHLVIGTTAIPPNSGGGQVLPEQKGILETKDGGETWKKIEGLPESFRAVHTFDATTDLRHMFVYAQHSNEEEKVFYSLDGGMTFGEVPRPVNFARFDPHDPTGMHLFGFSIYAQPNDFFESLDGGRTWNVVGKLPPEVSNDNRVSNIVWDPIDKNAVFLNAGLGRVWKSIDKGKTWELLLDLKKLSE